MGFIEFPRPLKVYFGGLKDEEKNNKINQFSGSYHANRVY